jgi:hypothetical protein
MSKQKKVPGARPAGTKRIVFQVPTDEDAWFSELVQVSGQSRIGLFRLLLDTFAEQVGFKPRPK